MFRCFYLFTTDNSKRDKKKNREKIEPDIKHKGGYTLYVTEM